MPDTAMRLAALAAGMTDAELAEILSTVGECCDATPEQRAAIDEVAFRLKAGTAKECNERGVVDP